MYSVEILADSINLADVRLTSFQLTYPRVMHAETLTHRVHSRSSASSRAIPSQKLIAMTEADPYYPIRWGKNQSGMQAKEENLSFEEYEEAKRIWDYMAQTCRYGVKRLNEIGLHKQWANRPLEWLSWITVIVSGTDWKNFLALRDHPAAMPEFGHIAAMVREAFARSTPKLLQPGEWHLPFTEDAADLRKTHHEDAIRMVSAGRCARVSYLNHEGVRDPIDDFRLAQRLTAQVPGHWGPFEHVARSEKTRARIRNFRGFTQYRALLDETSEEV